MTKNGSINKHFCQNKILEAFAKGEIVQQSKDVG